MLSSYAKTLPEFAIRYLAFKGAASVATVLTQAPPEYFNSNILLLVLSLLQYILSAIWHIYAGVVAGLIDPATALIAATVPLL